MITSISVRNFALIDDIEFDLNPGMTVLTGETGAGKSILLGAISLLLGKRADLSSTGDPSRKCVVEAVFDLSKLKLREFFEQQQLDYEVQTIIRREILPGGRSRGFINDVPVNLNQMQQLGGQLVDIHSQFETQTLNSQAYQLEVIDTMAGSAEVVKVFTDKLSSYKKCSALLEQLNEQLSRSKRDLDYHQYLLQELEQLDLENTDLSDLEQETEKLTNVEGIRDSINRISGMMQQESHGLMDQMFEIRRELSGLSGFGKPYESWLEQLQSILSELEDLSREMERESDSLEVDPERMATLSSQLEQIYQLQNKHHVLEIDQLIAIRDELRTQVDNSGEIELQIQQVQQDRQQLHGQMLELGKQLHEQRMQAIGPFIKQFHEILSRLGMPDAQLNIELKLEDDFNASGMDSIQWVFTANRGGRPGPLSKVASGGELSRIMLAIKSILSRKQQLPTLIFDEIDSGVSGIIAEQMAQEMSVISRHSQLLSITHLAQVAAKGTDHLRVYKKVEADRTTTHLSRLDIQERIVEIAQMIGGDRYSDSALAHARQMLN